ncbi:AI-2E family transporter [Dulcicalothrix desertica PCC 7102]|uniref:AI-2E family transporter n=1 Tax=Dulcicalothrix desertica PCC 7102 TaxID=232991 RepID=A0A3S1CZ54_9CYAN|nr:AI-2E family transporter [Dulcicalothrix desertica]RUT00653.1 AI-2E family transporter [Dulcicalothrix desertica PCC 7102]TWH49719.1 putative PurR-regulated permease PerM [Dulcicalothrix desertica PCC 7102]
MRFGQLTGFLALVISLYIIWQIRQIVLVIFAAIVLATVLNQLVQILQKFRIKRGIAIGVSVILVLVILLSFFALIVPRIVDQLQQFGNIMPMALERLRTWNNWLQGVIPEQLLENIRGLRYLTQGLQTWLNQLINNFFLLVSSSLSIALGILLFIALSIMLLANPSPYRQGFILLFPAFYRQRIDEILNKCTASLTGWFKGTLLTMAVIGVLSYIGLFFLKVPLPLVNALLAGILEFIPNVGPTLSVIPPTILALSEAPWKAAAVVALYFGIQQVESLILVPLVMKSQASLQPAVTLVAVVIFGKFFGFLGVFLAVPLVIVLQIWIQELLVKDVLNNWQRNKIYNGRQKVLTTANSKSNLDVEK